VTAALVSSRTTWESSTDNGRILHKEDGQPRVFFQTNGTVPSLGIANMLMAEDYDQRDPKACQAKAQMTALSCTSRLMELVFRGEHS
jgi:hypothetical protein